MSSIDPLLDAIFDGQKSALYAEFEGWVRGSRRFKAFATLYRDKIRAKLRAVRDENGMKDVRAELLAASILLAQPAFNLEYERYAASKQRGPDFTVTFRSHTPFNIEVRRLRSAEWRDSDARATQLAAVLCDKIGQMPPSIVNLLWLTADYAIAEPELIQALAALRQRADSKDEDYFTRRSFKSAAGFLHQYRQLSGILLHGTGDLRLWLNPLAKHKTPPEIAAALQRLHGM